MRGVMGKYTHLREDEIISRIEKFGTEDEREILRKIMPVLCPHCEDKDEMIDDLESKIKEAIQVLS